MASYTHIANDVQWATILCALPVSPQTFLEWNRLERLAFLANLAWQPQWQLHPYVVKIFGRLLQLPYPPQTTRPGEKEANAPGAPPSNPETSQRQPTVPETCTKDPLVDEETSLVIVRLPRLSPTSHEHCVAHLPHLEYPLIRICHSIPRPHNIILQAPCDLSIPWTMELRICDLPYRKYTEYQPRGREADLWGLLVSLERGGIKTVWGSPNTTDAAEHAARVAAVKGLKRQLDELKPRFGRTTKCCIINIGKGSKYNASCIHGKRPLFQGSGLVHNITLRTPVHTLITICLTSKKEEVSHGLLMMRHCLSGWLGSSRELPALTPHPTLRSQVWEYFPHDLARYLLQAKQLALENRGVKWMPTPPLSK